MDLFQRGRATASLVLALAAALLATAGCRSALTIPGQRLAVAPRADGGLDDFSRLITSQLYENGLMVGIGNDDRNLYVFFSPDIRHQRRLPGRAVLTVWLDAGGGRGKKLGLAVISGAPPPGRPGDGAASQGTPVGRGEQPLLKIIDRRSDREAFIAADGSLGPGARLASDWGDFAYQLRIPLQAAANGEWPGLNAGPGKDIGIGLVWKYESLAAPGPGDKDRPAGGPLPGGAEGDAPEMGPPGGMGGGRPVPASGRPGSAPAGRRTVWLRTRLAGR